jgi:sec-independent protein translocase protein TatA
MFGLGTTELLLIMMALLVFFGAKRLPELGKGLGQGLRGFKKGLRDDEENASPEQLPVESED